MATFSTAYQETAKAEGGYSNNASDRGGETWRGIARKKNPGWDGWPVIDALRMQAGFPSILKNNAGLQAKVLAFYKANYWDVLKLDTVKTQQIANKLYDIAVNCGTPTAGKFLQKALNVLNQNGKYYPDLTIDGQVGSKTIAALNIHPNQETVFKALNVLQGSYYIQIGENNESQEAFMNGWFINRIAALDKENNSSMA